MNYYDAAKIRKKGFAKLMTEKLASGQGVVSSVRGSLSDRSMAKSMAMKEKFDPMNIAKFLTGGSNLAPAIVGRLMGRSKQDIRYFTGKKQYENRGRPKYFEKFNPSMGGGSRKATEVLEKIVSFMKESNEKDIEEQDTFDSYNEMNEYMKEDNHKEVMNVFRQAIQKQRKAMRDMVKESKKRQTQDGTPVPVPSAPPTKPSAPTTPSAPPTKPSAPTTPSAPAKPDAGEIAKQQAAERARQQAKEQAEKQAAETARQQAEKQAKEQAEKAAKEQAAERARQQAEKQAKDLAEKQAKERAAETARQQAAERARQQAEKQAKEQAEKAAREAAEAKRIKDAADAKKAKDTAKKQEAAPAAPPSATPAQAAKPAAPSARPAPAAPAITPSAAIVGAGAIVISAAAKASMKGEQSVGSVEEALKPVTNVRTAEKVGLPLGVAKIGAATKDLQNSTSYGLFGINNIRSRGKDGSPNVGSSTMDGFVKMFPNFGLPDVGSQLEPEKTKIFKEAWWNLARSKPEELLKAQLLWFDRTFANPSNKGLAENMPANIANDAGVQLFMTDRRIQYGPAIANNAFIVGKGAKTPEEFIRIVGDHDRKNLKTYFARTYKNNPQEYYNIENGLLNRIQHRAKMALEILNTGNNMDDLVAENNDLKNGMKGGGTSGSAPIIIQNNTTNKQRTIQPPSAPLGGLNPRIGN